jgi:hypothetical protein
MAEISSKTTHSKKMKGTIMPVVSDIHEFLAGVPDYAVFTFREGKSYPGEYGTTQWSIEVSWGEE